MSVVIVLLIIAVILPLVALVLAVRDALTARPEYAQVTWDYSPEGIRHRVRRRVVDLTLIGGGVVFASVAGIVAELS